MPQTIFCANGSAGDKVEIPVAAVQKSLPKRRESAEKVEIPVAAVRKSLPKRRKSAEKVEIPVVAIRESLPKRRKSAEKVENPVAAVRESLPKRRKSAEKVENPESSPNLCVNSSSSYVSSSMLPLSSGDLIEWSLVCHSTLSYQKFCD